MLETPPPSTCRAGEIGVAVVAEDTVERMDGLSSRAGDHSLVKWRVPIGDGGVDFDHRIASIMRVDGPPGLARTAQVKGLTICRRPVALPEPGGDRLGVDGIGQTGKRRPKGFLAHMPCLHAQERAA